MDKKSLSTIIILVVVVIAIILIINHLKGSSSENEATMKCIAERSRVIVSPTCSACAYQKQILKENLEDYENYFELIDVSEHPEIWEEYSLEGVPTWIINETLYPGVRSIEELKIITGC